MSESEKERALKRPDKAGALWKVFKPDDTLLLRNSIVDWKRQNVRHTFFIFQFAFVLKVSSANGIHSYKTI